MRFATLSLLVMLILLVLLPACSSSNMTGVDGDNDAVEGVDDSTDGDNDIVENDDDPTEDDSDITEENDNTASLSRVTGSAYLVGQSDHSGIGIWLLLDDTVYAQTDTEVSGVYVFENVEAGTYRLIAEWGDYTVELTVETDVVVDVGKNTRADDLELTPTGDIDGTASLNSATSGNLGIEVFLAGYSYGGYTNDSGDYLLSRIPVGQYTLCARYDGYVMECRENVEVLAGQVTNASAIALELDDIATPQYTSISGTIKMVGEDDNSGIVVELLGTNNSTTTNNDGEFNLTQIVQGSYEIAFSAPDESGYDMGATLYDYRLFAGIPDSTLPELVLFYGQNLADFGPSGDSISTVQTYPDTSLAVFLNGDTLYALNVDSATLTWLADGAISFTLAPDGGSVIYHSEDEYLYAVSTLGGTPVELSWYSSLEALFPNESYEIQDDSSHILIQNENDDLTIMALDGSGETLLASDVQAYDINSDWSKVLYLTEESELYVIATTGGLPLKLAEDVKNYQLDSDWDYILAEDHTSTLRSVSLTTATSYEMGRYIIDYEAVDNWNRVIMTHSDYTLSSAAIDGSGQALLGFRSPYSSYDDFPFEYLPNLDRVLYMHTSNRFNSKYNLSSTPVTGNGKQWVYQSDLSISHAIFINDGSRMLWRDSNDCSYLTDFSTNTQQEIVCEYSAEHYKLNSSRTALVTYQNSQSLALYDLNTMNSIDLPEEITSYSFSKDGDTLVYLTNSLDSKSLYAQPVSGGSAVFLSDLVYKYQISPDSQTVIYRSTDSSSNAYSIPISGGSATELTNIRQFPDDQTITSDSQWIIGNCYSSINKLCKWSISGGDPIEMADCNRYYCESRITPDSQWVLFWDNQNILQSMPVSGGSITTLSSLFLRYGDVAISPNSEYVVYSAEDSGNKLMSCPVAGGAEVELGANDSFTSSSIDYVQFTSDSEQVIYYISGDNYYRVPVEGGIATPIIENDISPSISYTFSPDGSHILFNGYLVPFEGGAAKMAYYGSNGTKFVGSGCDLYTATNNSVISVPCVDTEDVLINSAGSVNSHAVSPDQTMIGYNTGYNFHTALTLTGEEIFASDYQSGGCIFSPDGSQLLYYSVSGLGEFSLYIVSSTGGTPTLLGTNFKAIAVNSDWSYVVCIHETDSGQFLVSAKLSDATLTTLSSNPYDFEIHEASQRVFYRVRDSESNTFSLHSIPIEGGTAATIAENVTNHFIVEADTPRFVIETGTEDNITLLSAAIDGSEVNVLGQDVQDYHVTSNMTHIYFEWKDATGLDSNFSAAKLDGSELRYIGNSNYTHFNWNAVEMGTRSFMLYQFPFEVSTDYYTGSSYRLNLVELP